MAALADDDEQADHLVEAVGEVEQRAPTMAGWTPERFLLTALVEAVQQLTAITVACHSEDGQVADIPHLPRPETALERARVRRESRLRDEVLAKILPRA